MYKPPSAWIQPDHTLRMVMKIICNRELNRLLSTQMKITCSRRSVMRSITKRIALLSAALMIVAVPALADESSMEGRFEQGQQSDKNECLLVAMNCGNQVDSIQQRIDRIKGEIGRGTAVY